MHRMRGDVHADPHQLKTVFQTLSKHLEETLQRRALFYIQGKPQETSKANPLQELQYSVLPKSCPEEILLTKMQTELHQRKQNQKTHQINVGHSDTQGSRGERY